MATKVKGSDVNGKQAANWKPANVSGILGVKVSPKCSQKELFDAIKKIVAESVRLVRADSTDDKYRNIVDMLMLRIRGALAATIEEIEENNSTVDTDALVEEIVKNVTSFIDTRFSPDDGLVIVNKSNVPDLLKAITNAIESNTAQHSAKAETKAEPKNEQTTTPDETPKTLENTSPKVETKQDTETVKENPAQITVEQPVSAPDSSKLQAVLDDNFKKLSLLMQSSVSYAQLIQTQIEKKSNATQTIIEKQEKIITVVANAVQAATAKVSSKTEPPIVKTVKNPAKQNTLSSAQFKSLTIIIQKYTDATQSFLISAAEVANNKFCELADKIESIKQSLQKDKVSWVGILAMLSLLILPMFYDKIKGWIQEFLDKFEISEWVDKFIKWIDLDKHISSAIDWLKTTIKEKFMGLLTNPMNFIIKKFKLAYTALTDFGKDIWNWVTGKSKETEQKQDENEKKAEQNVSQKLDASLLELGNRVDKNCTDTEKSCNEKSQKINEETNTATTTVSTDIKDMQDKTDSAITGTTEQVNGSVNDIQSSTLPNMQKSVEASANNAINSSENQLNSNISQTESKLNKSLDDLDKSIKENGAPTSVDKKTLDQMQQEADGGDIDVKVTETPKTPTTVTESTVQEQGKQVQLYANKADVDRAAKENGEVQKMQENAGIAGASNAAMPNVQNNVQNNISGKLIVNNTDVSKLDQDKTYEDMDKALDIVSQSIGTVESGFKQSNDMLKSIKESVNEYFTEINNYAKSIKDKPVSQTTNIVVQGGQQQGNDAGMDSF